ncbi:MAG: ATP-binding cassette domain-containing protein [Actinomycetaceae bacterium]|nr:ATP-binding cassette domain-containing protein [Actinomycetaceae bacterium]
MLEVRNLRVRGRTSEIVHGIDLSIAAGECLGLIGESGSGKSVTARALLDLAAPLQVSVDALSLAGADLRRPAARRAARGGQIGLIVQDALQALDPARSIGAGLKDAVRVADARAGRRSGNMVMRYRELLEKVGLPEAVDRLHDPPSAFSGGQRQRILIATALAGEPELLIADEPTSSLDAHSRRELMALVRALADEGRAVLFISHDLTSIRAVCDRIAVMSDGRIVESGVPERILTQPQSQAAQALVAALPRRPRMKSVDSAPIVDIRSISKSFAGRPVLEDVSVSIRDGETLGIVGPSGSGKTTLANIVLGLEQPDAGTVLLDDKLWAPLSESARRARRGQIGLIAQDTRGSFDPRLRVGQILADALSGGRTRRLDRVDGGRAAVENLLAEVDLTPNLLGALPRHLSGGQRQRLAIARALAAQPRVLVLDEAVSALDATVRRHVLTTFESVRQRRGLTSVFISHDLDVVGEVSDRIAVLAGGQIVEIQPSTSLLTSPQHELTQRLLGICSNPRYS